MAEGEISEGALQLMVDAAFMVKDCRRICPLTYDPVRRKNCWNQHYRRMLVCTGPCQDFCVPKLDDLKISRYGGLESHPL